MNEGNVPTEEAVAAVGEPGSAASVPLSVIVPVRNCEKYLGRCIAVLRGQAIEGMEIIVVDDASADDSAGVAERLAAGHMDMRVVRLRKGIGPGGARNVGLAHARGMYVGFVDADDIPHERMFAIMLNTAARAKADIAVCGVRRIDGLGLKRPKIAVPVVGHGARELLRGYAPGGVLASCCNKIFRRGFIEANGLRFPATRYAEDLAFAFKAMACEPRVAVVPRHLYTYVLNPGSASVAPKALLRRCDTFASLLDVAVWLRQRRLFRAYRREMLRQVWRHGMRNPLCFVLIDSLKWGADRMGTMRAIPLFVWRETAFLATLLRMAVSPRYLPKAKGVGPQVEAVSMDPPQVAAARDRQTMAANVDRPSAAMRSGHRPVTSAPDQRSGSAVGERRSASLGDDGRHVAADRERGPGIADRSHHPANAGRGRVAARAASGHQLAAYRAKWKDR